MIPLVIRVQQRSAFRFFNNRKVRFKSWTIELPQSWKEMSEELVLYAIDQLTLELRNTALLKIAQKILNLPKLVFYNLGSQHLAEIIAKLEWMKLMPSPTPILQRFTHRGQEFVLPTKDFQNGTALEYPIADEYYQEFLEGNPEALMKLVATLCRPITPAHPKGEKLPSRANIPDRIKQLEGLPEKIKGIVILYFAGVKQTVYDTYKGWLWKDIDTEIDEDAEIGTESPQEAEEGIMFGWWGLYMEVAETGVFGQLNEVYQSSFHSICMYRVLQKKREIQQQPQSPNHD